MQNTALNAAGMDSARSHGANGRGKTTLGFGIGCTTANAPDLGWPTGWPFSVYSDLFPMLICIGMPFS